MRYAPSVLLLAAAFVSSDLARAGVLVVAAGGAGSFTDLPAAVNAAADGDVLLVKSGNYSGFTLNDKSLDIVADAGAVVNVTSSVVLTALGASRTVTMSGLRVESSLDDDAVLIDHCTGAVRIQDCSFRGRRSLDCTTMHHAGTALVDYLSTDVCVVRCTLEGAEGRERTISSSDAGAGLLVTNSRCSVFDSTLSGGQGGHFSGVCGYGYGMGSAGDGGTALVAVSSPLMLASGCTLRGGNGGNASAPFPAQSGCGGPGWWTFQQPSGAVSRRIGISALGGLPGTPVTACGPARAAEFLGSPVPVLLTRPARSLVAPNVLRESTQLDFDLTGIPGEPVELVFSERSDFVFSDAWRGVRLVRWKPAPLAVLLLGTIAGNGRLHASFLLGDLGPGLVARRLFVQAVHGGVGSGPCIGPLAIVVVLDSAY